MLLGEITEPSRGTKTKITSPIFFPRRIRVTRTAAMLNAAKTKALPETMAPKCDSTHAKPYSGSVQTVVNWQQKCAMYA